jgi:glycerol-3-phosphate dehydrogenase
VHENRADVLESLASRMFDLLVVGGSIVGADEADARDLHRRGRMP